MEMLQCKRPLLEHDIPTHILAPWGEASTPGEECLLALIALMEARARHGVVPVLGSRMLLSRAAAGGVGAFAAGRVGSVRLFVRP